MMLERANAGLHQEAFGWLSAHIGEPIAGMAALDLGCGTGAWLNRLHEAGAATLHGVDRDADQFQLAGAAHTALDLDFGDLPTLGTFDLITGLEIMEHLYNPGRFMQFAARHCRPGGYLFITSPNIESLPARLRLLLTGRLPHFDQKSDPTHCYPVYHHHLVRLAAAQGLYLRARGCYPAQGYHNFSRGILLAAGLLSAFLPRGFGGDNGFWLFQKPA